MFAQLLDDARASGEVRKTFFENVRPLVLNLIFVRLEPELKEGLSLVADEEAAIRAKATEFAELAWTVARARGFVAEKVAVAGAEPFEATKHFRSVFCSAADCQNLRSGVLELLNRPPERGPDHPGPEIAAA
ncbi:MAG: hypothetical protein EOP84_11165 [Verrucomicrobiaceae bacterium]|nr:MAG: hypothetical protein EOP84_11165 [Verrucomicrobiaceae bacterium]